MVLVATENYYFLVGSGDYLMIFEQAVDILTASFNISIDVAFSIIFQQSGYRQPIAGMRDCRLLTTRAMFAISLEFRELQTTWIDFRSASNFSKSCSTSTELSCSWVVQYQQNSYSQIFLRLVRICQGFISLKVFWIQVSVRPYPPLRDSYRKLMKQGPTGVSQSTSLYSPVQSSSLSTLMFWIQGKYPRGSMLARSN